MNLTQIAFVVFAAIAAGGSMLLAAAVFGVRVPRFIGPAHGLGGLAAMALLLVANLVAAASGRAWWAFAVFALGLLGGAVLFRFGGAPPARLAALHGAAAAIGLYLLYGVAF